MCPESTEAVTIVAIGEEEESLVVTGAALGDAVGDVATPLTLLVGATTSPDVEAMLALLTPDGWVARAVPVTDALKSVEDGTVSGDVDRSSVVRLRLPILASTETLRAIAATAAADHVEVVAALAATGTGTAFIRT